MSKRKKYLIRKNMGRLERPKLISHLNNNGISSTCLLDLAESDGIIEMMKPSNILSKESEILDSDFEEKIGKVLAKEVNSSNNYLWTIKADYCGLLELKEFPSIQNIRSILNDKYFGGFITLYFIDYKKRIDIDIDENPKAKNQWYYSYVYSSTL